MTWWTSEPAVPSFPCRWPLWMQVCLQSRPASPAQRLHLASQGLPRVNFCGLPHSHIRGVESPASAECLAACTVSACRSLGTGRQGAGAGHRLPRCPSWEGGWQPDREGVNRERARARRQKEGWGLCRPMGLGQRLPSGGATSPPAWLVPPRGTQGCGKSLASGKFGFQIRFCRSVSRVCCWGR